MAKKKSKLTFEEFKQQVSDTYKRIYGITWDDACGDDEPLKGPHEHGDTPEEFVRWDGERHDLDTLEELGLT